MGSYSRLWYHVVFCCKNRLPLLKADMRERIFQFMGGGVRAQGGVSLGVNGTADHMHLLISVPRDKALSDVIRDIKSISSGWIQGTFRRPSFAWQTGYAVFTVSESRVNSVANYIQRQEEHHRRVDFHDELIGLLKAHKIEFDPRYLWS